MGMKRATKRGLLTPREQQILDLIWKGLSNREMAQQLAISVKTVEAHRASIMTKLRVTNTAQTIQVAINLGLIKSRQAGGLSPPRSCFARKVGISASRCPYRKSPLEGGMRIFQKYLGWWIALGFLIAGLIWGGWYDPW